MELEKQGQTNIIWLSKRSEELQTQIENFKQQIAELEDLYNKEQANSKSKEISLQSINQRLENVRTELNKIQKTVALPFEAEQELELIFKEQQDLVSQLAKVEKIEELQAIKNKAREISQKLAVYLEKLKSVKKQGAENLQSMQSQLETLTNQKNDLSLELTESSLHQNAKREKISNLNQEITRAKAEQESISKEISLSQINPANKNELNQRIEKDLKELAVKVADLDNKIKEQGGKISQFNLEEQNKKETLISLQKEFQEKQSQINQYSQQINQFNIELAKYSTKKEDLESEISQEEIDLKTIANFSPNLEMAEDLAYQKIQQLKRQIEIIGGIDEETMKEYTEIKERFDFLKSQSDDLEQAITSLEKIIEELDATIKEQFDKAFKEINKEFQKYFKILFNGGQAELLKVTAEEVKKESAEDLSAEALAKAEEEVPEGILIQADKFEKRIKERERESYSGIEIKATPPGKKIKAINMLSGGERALTSIALICAIISNNPSPFIVLDEVDAALDEANAERFDHILTELAHKTQFIVITH
ncbi:MAG: hypothetical protein NT116_06670, partial [Candidatus Parcubacteria bacterium]|nr:hypothetical protein [Candidatus Parcubacteria bacterium]